MPRPTKAVNTPRVMLATSPVLTSAPVLVAARDVFTPAELDARIAAHAERVAREDPGAEPVRCWGCGRPSRSAVGGSNGAHAMHGWRTREVPGYRGLTECHCPGCYRKWGWGSPFTAIARPRKPRKTRRRK